MINWKDLSALELNCMRVGAQKKLDSATRFADQFERGFKKGSLEYVENLKARVIALEDLLLAIEKERQNRQEAV